MGNLEHDWIIVPSSGDSSCTRCLRLNGGGGDLGKKGGGGEGPGGEEGGEAVGYKVNKLINQLMKKGRLY